MRRAVEAIWNGGELDVADQLFAPDYVNHNGLIPDLVHGPEAIKISVAGYRLAFPHLHITVDELSTEDQTVVLHWTAHSRPTNAVAGGAHTAEQRLLAGTMRVRLTEGMIIESWTQWERAEPMRGGI